MFYILIYIYVYTYVYKNTSAYIYMCLKSELNGVLHLGNVIILVLLDELLLYHNTNRIQRVRA